MFNGVGVAGGGLIGYGIGQIKGALASWRYEFIIVGAACALWGIVIFFYLPNSPVTSKNWFSRDERLMIIARARRNQTGLDSAGIKWYQIREAALDWKTYTFFMLVSSALRY
jgi:MFS family permease